MDSPRPFRGFRSPNYTQVPDELFDELLAELSGAELKVVLYVVRRTFGFKKGSDRISKKQLESGIKSRDGRVLDRGTGLSRRAIRLAVDSLVEKNILVKVSRYSDEKGNEATEYALNVIRPSSHKDGGGPPSGNPDASPGVPSTHGEGTDESAATPRVLSTHGEGTKVPRPVGRGVPPQKTVTQETENTGTGIKKSPSQKASPKEAKTINWAALQRTYGLDETHTGRVLTLVELQQRVLQQPEQNHSLYVQRAAEATRDGLDGVLEQQLRNAEEDFARKPPRASRSQAFHGRWRNFLEDRSKQTADPVDLAALAKRSSGLADSMAMETPQRPGARNDPSEERRRTYLEQLLARGYQIPERVAQSSLKEIAAWADSHGPIKRT